MIKTFLAQGFLLAEHSVFEDLARALLNSSKEQQAQSRWTIVCERKEDLLAVRTQIFSLLNKYHQEQYPGEELRSWAGVSLYTPDTLVRNFALTLSHNKPEQIGQQSFDYLRQPFLDVVEQEKMTRLLLLRLGYSLSDVAPLAKQILTLADTPLPAEESFLNLLFQVQNANRNAKSILDIPDSSLRTICVGYQLVQKIFSTYVRLQSFVGQYWQSTFIQNLSQRLDGDPRFKDFLLPTKFISEPLLWVGAPEYLRDSSAYRPGNFQASIVDTLRDGLFEARKLWLSHHALEQPTWWARTQIQTTEIHPTEASAHIHVLGSYAALTDHFNNQWSESEANCQFLLGDINKRIFNVVRSDGSGVHALTPLDFQFEDNPDLQNDEQTNQEKDLHWLEPAADKVNKLRQEFQSYWDKLARFDETITDALTRYDLSPSMRQHGVSFDLMLHRFFDSETFTFAVDDNISSLPPALSLLPGVTPIQEFIVLGPPHSPTAPSFHLRLLNTVFHLLRSQGVSLEPIASEESYRGYWQSILSRGARVTFLLRTVKDLKDFPVEALRWCLPPTKIANWSGELLPQPAFERWLGDRQRLQDEQWHRLLRKNKDAEQKSLSVTEFEDYVECPLQFYWVQLHGLEQDVQPELQADPLITGIRVHALAEKLIRGLRHICLLDNANHGAAQNTWLQFFIKLQDSFLNHEVFLSQSPDRWMHALQNVISTIPLSQQQRTHADVLVEELTEVLFSIGDEVGESTLAPIKRRLVRETIRRAFKKLVQSELQDFERHISTTQDTTLTRAAYIETPVEYLVHPQLKLTGRMDRVDTHPHGDRIIDYKTSKVSKKDPALVLDPRAAKSTNKLSVQGAIYSLAWAHRLKDDDETRRGVRSFTLLRLKTLDLSRDPYSSFNFDAPMKFGDEQFESLAQVYSQRASILMAGDFSPRPLTPGVCMWCPLKSVCPAQGSSGEDES